MLSQFRDGAVGYIQEYVECRCSDVGHSIGTRSIEMVCEQDSTRISPAFEALASFSKIGVSNVSDFGVGTRSIKRNTHRSKTFDVVVWFL
jgi:hypothetical protein